MLGIQGFTKVDFFLWKSLTPSPVLVVFAAMNSTIKISSEFPEQLAKVAAELLRQGIRFDVVEYGAEWIIELKGY